MVRSKAPAKKQQKKGIDFKKIKRKLGRKLPPPKNATNTEIKSKAIILPEQSVAAEKGGLATSKKGLTLKELLQQSSHHNAKVRKDALHGIKDLFKNHPAELLSHKYAIIQKLRERVSDDDKHVRDTFYQLFNTQIFPACKEDNQGPMVSLLMPYIFKAMADSAIDVRLMAFKFFHLVVEYYPPTFSLHAQEVLENYRDVIQKNHFYVQDKSNLKVALSGLAHCLSLLPCDESDAKSQKKARLPNEPLLAYEQDVPQECIRFADVSGRLKEIVGALINCFQDFIPLIHAPRGFDAQSFECIHHILCSIRYAIKFSIRSHIKTLGKWWCPTASENATMMILEQDMAPMLSKKLLGSFPLNPENNLSGKADERYFILNSVLTEIFLAVSKWSDLPTDLSNRFLESIESTLLGKMTKSNEKTLFAFSPFISELILRVDSYWKEKLLQAFTAAFTNCKPESTLMLAFISIIRNLIIPKGELLSCDPKATDPILYYYQSAWVNKLPSLLIQLGDKHPVSTQVILRLLHNVTVVGCLSVSKVWCLNVSPTFEDDVRNFFSHPQGEGDLPGGLFASIPWEVQELALAFLRYFIMDNKFNAPMLKAIVQCCLHPQLEPEVLYRIVEVFDMSYRDGYIQIPDYCSFLITLIVRFKVFPENLKSAMECNERETYCRTLKELTNRVGISLSRMGDSSLVLKIVEKILLEQIIAKPALDNGCAILRIIFELDSKPTRLSESSLTTLSEFLPGYLIDIVNYIPEDKEDSYLYMKTCVYYLVPCYFLFDRSSKLTEQVLKRMESMVSENTKALETAQDREMGQKSLKLIQSIVSVILLMLNDVKVRKIFLSSKSEIDLILQNVITLQSSRSTSLTVEAKHMMKIAGERLKIASKSLLA